ncbi:MAG: hypothetical protein E5Y31_00125 [Mesorhizobium sp.]|nr:MAG: hypothetical protein E5Y31_00125 [Mesorhizobium sp.]
MGTGSAVESEFPFLTVEQKLAIVREVEETGDPVAAVARRHDLNANYFFILMKQSREGRLGGRPNPLSTETSPAASSTWV